MPLLPTSKIGTVTKMTHTRQVIIVLCIYLMKVKQMALDDDGTRRIATASVFVDEARLVISVVVVVNARRRHVAKLAILASCTSLNLINSLDLRVRRLSQCRSVTLAVVSGLRCPIVTRHRLRGINGDSLQIGKWQNSTPHRIKTSKSK